MSFHFADDTGNILVSASLFPAMCSYFLQLESLSRVVKRGKRNASHVDDIVVSLPHTSISTMEISALHGRLIMNSPIVEPTTSSNDNSQNEDKDKSKVRLRTTTIIITLLND